VAESLRFSNELVYRELMSLNALKVDVVTEGLFAECFQTLDLWQRSSSLHRFITPRLLLSDRGILVEVPPKNKVPAKIPWTAMTEILDLQSRVAALAERLLEIPNLSKSLLSKWKIWCLMQKSNSVKEQQWYERLSAEMLSWGFLLKEGADNTVITPKGLAAAGIRATEMPHVFVEACLAGPEITDTQARELASLLCGAGKEAAAEVALLRGRVPAEMLQTLNVSEARMQAAVVLWAEGKTLFEIQTETTTPPGTFSKHIVRCCDLLLEAAGALWPLSPQVARTLEEARLPLVRGLPFLQLAVES
jgi:hypothetical protein